MKLTSKAITAGQPIPDRCAFCVIDPDTHVTLGRNLSPDLAWTDVPEGTGSFAIVLHDSDVPTKPDDVNQEGREVPSDLPRADFYHWALANLPGDSRGLEEGEFSEGVTARGKDTHVGPRGAIQGKNDYTGWFAGDADMAGDYIGYDGPCPPWNDSIIHHYHVTVYALSVEAVSMPEGFTGSELRAAIEPHVLAKASITGTFTLNPRLR